MQREAKPTTGAQHAYARVSDLRFTNGGESPLFDLTRFESPDPAEAASAARDLDRICREVGFVVIRNHGVPEAVQTALYDARRPFSTCRSTRR